MTTTKEITVMYSDAMNIADLAKSLGKALVFIDDKNMVPLKIFVPHKIHKQLSEAETYIRGMSRIDNENKNTLFGVPFEISTNSDFTIAFTYRNPIYGDL